MIWIASSSLLEYKDCILLNKKFCWLMTLNMNSNSSLGFQPDSLLQILNLPSSSCGHQFLKKS